MHIIIFVDFTHIPPSQYLFQGADIENCTTNTTLDSSSDGKGNASLNRHSDCKGPDIYISEHQNPEYEHSSLMLVSSHKNSSDTKAPIIHQACSITEAKGNDEISSKHDKTVLNDTYEPLYKKLKLND